MKKYHRTEKYDQNWISENWMGSNPLWEKTGIVSITACYNISNPKEIWRPWAAWAGENLGFVDETPMLDADTGDDIAFVVLAARKRGAE